MDWKNISGFLGVANLARSIKKMGLFRVNICIEWGCLNLTKKRL